MTARTPTLFSAKRWTCGSATKSSLSHLALGRTGQDAAYARLLPRPIILVADGRGSSEKSEIGAGAAADCFAQVVDRHSALVAQCLDSPTDDSAREEQWRSFVELLHIGLVERQEELARAHSVDTCELEFTLAAAVVGRKYVGVVQIGDSCVAVERALEIQLAMPPDRGEFANETNFISARELAASRIAARTFPAADVTGLVAFTDGLLHRWLDARTLAVAPGVGRILRNLGDRVWDQRRLDAFLDHPIWHDSDDDDRGVAYLVTKISGAGSKPRRRRAKSCS